MTEVDHPLKDETRPLYLTHHKVAWAAKADGVPSLALKIWLSALATKRDQMTAFEEAAVRQQVAVSLRGLMMLEEADKNFRQAFALCGSPDVEIDRSAVLLDQRRPNEAIELLENLQTEDGSLQATKKKAAIGRAYGHKGRLYRKQARMLLSEALEEARDYPDLQLDILASCLEMRWWRGRCEHYRRTLRFANEHRPKRMNDVHVRYIGGAWLHRLLRQLLGFACRIRV